MSRVLVCLPVSLPELTSSLDEGAACDHTQTYPEQGDEQGQSLWATGVADTKL